MDQAHATEYVAQLLSTDAHPAHVGHPVETPGPDVIMLWLENGQMLNITVEVIG